MLYEIMNLYILYICFFSFNNNFASIFTSRMFISENGFRLKSKSFLSLKEKELKSLTDSSFSNLSDEIRDDRRVCRDVRGFCRDVIIGMEIV